MHPNLLSVNSRVDWAEQQFHILKQEIFAYFHHRPYRYIERVSDDFRKYSIVITRTECEPPVERWALLTGDCLHNLRAALDNLIYAIAVAKHRSPPPDEDILAFPIALKPNAFSSFKGKFSAGTLSNALWECLRGLQPDIRTNPDVPAFLEILATLDNHNKHRLLRLAVASPEQYDIGFDFSAVPIGERSSFRDEAYYGEIKAGTEIHSITFERPARNAKYDRVNLDMNFSIWHGAKDPNDPRLWKHRSNMLGVLREIIDEVKAIIPIVLANMG